MHKSYSLYEAKARLSEIIRHVRENGDSATITYHGRAVARILPVVTSEDPLQARLDELTATGELTLAENPAAPLPEPIAHIPGALAEFLAERDED